MREVVEGKDNGRHVARPEREQRSAPSLPPMLQLQAAAGNRAVVAMLDTAAVPRPSGHSSVQRVRPIISAPPDAGTSSHPQLTKGGTNDADAVKELQQKLNTGLEGGEALVVDGVFGDKTETRLKAFQKANGLGESGVADKATWAILDTKGKSSVGRVERDYTESLTSGDYGMTAKYSWSISDTQVLVKVGIKFLNDATDPVSDFDSKVAELKLRITSTWNKFKAKKKDAADARDIVFQVVDSGGNDVTLVSADGASDAGTWYWPQMQLYKNAPAHEFGHMIGLEDEYLRTEADHRRLHPGGSEESVLAAKGAEYGDDQYTDTTSMMGTGAIALHPDANNDPEPRHVREFAKLVQDYLGGEWDVVKK